MRPMILKAGITILFLATVIRLGVFSLDDLVDIEVKVVGWMWVLVTMSNLIFVLFLFLLWKGIKWALWVIIIWSVLGWILEAVSLISDERMYVLPIFEWIMRGVTFFEILACVMLISRGARYWLSMQKLTLRDLIK